MAKPETPIEVHSLTANLETRPGRWYNLEKRVHAVRLRNIARGLFGAINHNHPYLLQEPRAHHIFEDQLPAGTSGIALTTHEKSVSLHVLDAELVYGLQHGTSFSFTEGNDRFAQWSRLYHNEVFGPLYQTRPAGAKESPYENDVDYQTAISKLGLLSTHFANPATEPSHTLPLESLPDEQYGTAS